MFISAPPNAAAQKARQSKRRASEQHKRAGLGCSVDPCGPDGHIVQAELIEDTKLSRVERHVIECTNEQGRSRTEPGVACGRDGADDLRIDVVKRDEGSKRTVVVRLNVGSGSVDTSIEGEDEACIGVAEQPAVIENALTIGEMSAPGHAFLQ